ncbi:MAG: hypothetical protein GX594_15770 [Pirellulaceae bacterium]|nr:hypothetical protein [Pirellulaceae bacterium]
MKRYAAKVKWFDDIAARLADAGSKAESGMPIPSPEEIGLAFPKTK